MPAAGGSRRTKGIDFLPGDRDDQVKLFLVRRKLGGSAAAGLLLAALFAAIALDFEGILRLIAALVAVGAGAATVGHLRRLFGPPKPFLTISDDGFTDNSPFGVGFVEWSEVTDIWEQRFRKARWVQGRVRDPVALRRRRSVAGRVLTYDRHAHFSISDSQAPMSAEEILGLMTQRWNRASE